MLWADTRREEASSEEEYWRSELQSLQQQFEAAQAETSNMTASTILEEFRISMQQNLSSVEQVCAAHTVLAQQLLL